MTRDRLGRVRDISYANGRSRSIDYVGDSDEIRKIVIDKKTTFEHSQGRNWTSRDQYGRMGTWTGDMSMSQDGVFSYTGQDGLTHNYLRNGRDVIRSGNDDGRRDPGRRDNSDSGSERQRRDGSDRNRGRRELSDAAFDQTVKQVFDQAVTNKEDYKQALFGAAADRKPVVMVFGRSSDPESRQLVETAIKQARAGDSGQKAMFAFVDLDKVDPNSAIGRYGNEYIDRNYGSPFTMVFTQKQGVGKTPVIPEPALFYQRGQLDGDRIGAAIAQAQEIQSQREFADLPDNFRRDRSSTADAPLKNIEDLLKQANKPELTNQQQYDLYRQAIDAADKLNRPEVSGATRMELGLACIRWGAGHQSGGDTQKASQSFETGAQWLLDAGHVNPRIYQDPQFIARLKNSDLPGTAAEELLTRGQQNSDWYRPTQAEAQADSGAWQKKYQEAMQVLNDAMKKPRTRPRTTPLRPESDPYGFNGAESANR